MGFLEILMPAASLPRRPDPSRYSWNGPVRVGWKRDFTPASREVMAKENVVVCLPTMARSQL